MSINRQHQLQSPEAHWHTRTHEYNTSATLQGYNDTSIHLPTHFLWVNHSSSGTYYPFLVPSSHLGLGQNLINIFFKNQQTTCAKVRQHKYRALIILGFNMSLCDGDFDLHLGGILTHDDSALQQKLWGQFNSSSNNYHL